MKKRELVYSELDKRNIIAIRESNQTLLVNRNRTLSIIDSDRSILTDKRGFRYCRQIDLEIFNNNTEHYIYFMI